VTKASDLTRCPQLPHSPLSVLFGISTLTETISVPKFWYRISTIGYRADYWRDIAFCCSSLQKGKGEILLKPSLHDRLIRDSKETPNSAYSSIEVTRVRWTEMCLKGERNRDFVSDIYWGLVKMTRSDLCFSPWQMSGAQSLSFAAIDRYL
jgi:hypothetical protein